MHVTPPVHALLEDAPLARSRLPSCKNTCPYLLEPHPRLYPARSQVGTWVAAGPRGRVRAGHGATSSTECTWRAHLNSRIAIQTRGTWTINICTRVRPGFLTHNYKAPPASVGGGGVGDQGPAPRGTTARPSPRLEQVPSREVGGESRPKERQIPSKNREIIKKGVLRVKPPRGNYPPLASRPLPPPSLPPLSAPSGINPEREARSPARSRQIDPRGGHISLYPPVSSGVGLA